MGWIDPEPLDQQWQADPLRSSVSQVLVQLLSASITCGGVIGDWLLASTLGNLPAGPHQVDTEADRRFANYFLNYHSANDAPPSEWSSSEALRLSPNDYRAFQRLQSIFEVGGEGISSTPQLFNRVTALGNTPEPCSSMQVPIFSLPGELHNDHDGVARRSGDKSLVFQVNEGRISYLGQAVNKYLNRRNAPNIESVTPYIWSAIQFDVNGNLRPLQQAISSNTANIQIFPSYAVYQRDYSQETSEILKVTTVQQRHVEEFISKDATSFHQAP